MAEPKIDENWHGDDNLSLRPFLVVGIPVLVLVVAILLSCFKGCTALGQKGQEDVYNPATEVDEGFVGGANKLLKDLLADTADIGPVVDLESLNRKYRSLTFALPYGEEHKAVIEASDLRLVAINPERIKKEDERVFYFNSRLPKLLQDQRMQLTETFFRIRCESMPYDPDKNTKPIKVSSIEVIPSMFKVALRKDPWNGVVVGAKNCLFDDARTVYLTYGNSMLPLPIESSPTAIHDTYKYYAIADEGILCDDKLADIDYYKHYKSFFTGSDAERRKALNITMSSTRSQRANQSLNICCVGENLYVRSDFPVVVFSSKGEKRIAPYEREGQNPNEKIALEDGLKLAAYDASNHKLGEFTVYKNDPTLVLSKLIQTNVGKQRYNIGRAQTDLFTQQVLRGVSRNLSNSYNIDTVAISLDPMLSKVFEKEIKDYLATVRKRVDAAAPKNQVRTQYDMSVTIMDIATGDILATPYYTSRFDDNDISDSLKMLARNSAMSRRYIGSTFKPMVALAAVQTNHNLLNLDTHGKYTPDWTNKTATFFGHKTHAWGEETKRHWNGTTFADFLSYSDDVYPVALTAIAMTGQDVSASLPLTGDDNMFTADKRDFLRFKNQKDEQVHTDIKNNPFLNWLSYLYAANVAKDYTTDTLLFRNLYKDIEASRLEGITFEEKVYGLEELSPDVTNLRCDRFFEGGYLRGYLAPWVLGQGDNQWSCIKLAEAWSRMLGKREVCASLIKTTEIPRSMTDINAETSLKSVHSAPLTTASVNTTWNGFLSRFSQAQNFASTNGGNTLRRMYDAVNTLNANIDRQLVLFSKTGTPEEYTRYETTLLGGNNRQIDIGMYSFGLIDNNQYQLIQNNQLGHGIVCIVRITRTYECKECNRQKEQCNRCKGFRASLQSTQARNFFSESQTRLRKLYDLTRRYY